MKAAILLLTAILGTLSAWAQTRTPPPGTISRPPPNRATAGTNTNASATANTNQPGLSGLTFTNQAGATYSVDQLANQLRTLRTSIEQILPMLAAFNDTFSNSAAGGQNSIAGAIAGILDSMRHGTNQAAAGPSGQTPIASTSAETNNLLTVLERLLTTNAPGAVSISPNTLQDLVTLQTDLQPVVSILQNLHVGSATNEFAPPLKQPAVSGAPPENGRPTPTGR